MNVSETTEEVQPEGEEIRDFLEAALPEETEGGVSEEAKEAAPEAASPAPEGETEPVSLEAKPESEREPEQLRLDEPAADERYPGLNEERITRAPEGWKPVAREGWDALPEPVRREVHRREMDIARGLEESANARKFTEQFQQVTQPYEAMMKAEGAQTPLHAVQSLMETAGVLNMGTPQQKAQRIAALIKHYGVGIEELDSVLTGQIESGGAPAAPVDDRLEQRLAPLEQRFQEIDQRLQQAHARENQRLDQQVEQFKQGKEFFEDVRGLMADEFKAAQENGWKMDMETAYGLACQRHPEVRQTLADREQRSQMVGQEREIERKMAVAQSSRPPTSNGAGPAARSGGDDIRSLLRSQFDEHEIR